MPGEGAVPARRSTPGGTATGSAPPERSDTDCSQRRATGASEIRAPQTVANQPVPATAVDTSRAIARFHTPPRCSAHTATTPTWTSSPGTPSSRARTRCSRTVVVTRWASTADRWARTDGVAAARTTVRAASSAEPSAAPKSARASAATRPVAPASGAPATETRVVSTSTAATTPPASALPAATAVASTTTIPVTASTQRST